MPLCLTLNLLLLINLLIPVFRAFGVFVAPARDGNIITEPLEFFLNIMVPIALLAHAAGIILYKRNDHPQIMRSMIWSSAVFILITITGLIFGYWYFSIVLEGIIKFSSRVWWLF